MLTTTEAAAIAGVGTSTIKRWADAGLLPTVRTAGGHRRFEREAIARLLHATAPSSSPAHPPAVDAWLRTLVGGNLHELLGMLQLARSRCASWCEVADDLGVVLTALGLGWREGRFTVADEHRASDACSRALARLGEGILLGTAAPRCVLACAGDDEHTLGLSLAELCLRESGYVSIWLGRHTPLEEILRLVAHGEVELVALSASSASDDAAELAGIARTLASACEPQRVGLLLGGAGAWPEHPGYGVRVRSFAGLQAWLRAFRPSAE